MDQLFIAGLRMAHHLSHHGLDFLLELPPGEDLLLIQAVLGIAWVSRPEVFMCVQMGEMGPNYTSVFISQSGVFRQRSSHFEKFELCKEFVQSPYSHRI